MYTGRNQSHNLREALENEMLQRERERERDAPRSQMCECRGHPGSGFSSPSHPTAEATQSRGGLSSQDLPKLLTPPNNRENKSIGLSYQTMGYFAVQQQITGERLLQSITNEIRTCQWKGKCFPWELRKNQEELQYIILNTNSLKLLYSEAILQNPGSYMK